MLAKLVKVIMGMVMICIFFSGPLKLNGILAMFVCGAVLCILYKLPMKEKYFIIGLILWVFATRVASVFLLQTPLESDFLTMFQISNELVSGSLSDASHYYMNEYTYQVPYILYQAGLLFMNPGLLFLKCCNIVYSIVTVLLLYSITKKIASKGAARITTVCYATLIFPITYASIISNQWIATIFLLLGIRLCLAKDTKLLWVKPMLVGLCIGISALLRPDALVSVLAVVAYFIYLLITQRKKWKYYLKSIAIFLVTYLVLTNSVMGILQHTSLITEGSKDDYLWKFVCGLNEKTSGTWSVEDYNLVYDGSLSREERKELELQLIKERFTQANLFTLWKEKINIYWNRFEYFWALGYTQNIEVAGKQVLTEKIIHYAHNIDSTIWGGILILAFVGLWQNKKKAMLMYAILIGTFLIYLWIEVQGRYSYYTMLIMFMIAAMGIDKVVKYIHMRKKERKHAES